MTPELRKEKSPWTQSPASPVSVIIVTNNSEPFLPKALKALENQTRNPGEVILVDTGSTSKQYLHTLDSPLNIKTIIGGNGIGFCKGNNIGLNHVSKGSEYIFFLNPDAFLFPEFLEKAASFMEDPINQKCGAVTGTTFGYDIDNGKPRGKYDTTGIFRTWYGRWYDRGQGNPEEENRFAHVEEIPAICGAVFFCRRKALEDVLIREKEAFDETFYMYKEDIDLSIRLRNKGWKLVFHPALKAYHCRGWAASRKKVARAYRLHSAKNEAVIHYRGRHPIGILYSTMKWTLVRFFDL